MDPFFTQPSAPSSSRSADDDLAFDLLCATAFWSQGRTTAERASALINDLRVVDEGHLRDLGKESDSCTICFQEFLALLKDDGGVVQLGKGHQCGHLFCKKDIIRWIKDDNATCPICRQELVEDGLHPRMVGGTPRVLEHYRQQGIRVHNTSFRVPTAEERREQLFEVLRGAM